MRLSCLTLGLAALTLSAVLRADEDPWLVRLRGVSVQPANKSDAIPALGVPADAIHVSNKFIPEVDFSYFFTPNFATELVLTYPQSHTVSLMGAGIGSFKELPPTLTAQWHFLPGAMVNPYVGAGLNLTLLSSVSLAVPGVGPLTLNSSSVGLAGQVGVDIAVAPKWTINLDAKYVKMQSDVDAGGVKVSRVHVDPWLLGIGIGYRFGCSKSTAAPAPAPMAAPAPPPPPPAPVAAPMVEPVPPPPAPMVEPPPPPPAPVPPPAPAPQKIVLSQAVLHFANGKNALSPEGAAAIRTVASDLKKLQGDYTLIVSGHTSASGSAAFNKALSLRRAQAVAKILVGEGIPAAKVKAVGIGPDQPIADNKTEEGQATNRRVEIEVKTDVKVEKRTLTTGKQ